MPQSAAARSPFTPIALYGFLSSCHTGALVASDGTVGWLCVPRFDSPSVFGALLDRGAGGFRFGPFGINVPGDRIYEPGTNSLVTSSWKTPTGWVVVRDALTMGPRRGKDTVTPHSRPPADEDADHALVRTAQCIDGMVEIDLVCEPTFDYGRVPGDWTLSEDEHRAEATGADQKLRLQTDMLVGIEGDGLEPATSCAPVRRSSARSPGARTHVSRAPPRRRSSSSRPRRCSGATGSRAR
jgi:alpha,alpha-trehalase